MKNLCESKMLPHPEGNCRLKEGENLPRQKTGKKYSFKFAGAGNGLNVPFKL